MSSVVRRIRRGLSDLCIEKALEKHKLVHPEPVESCSTCPKPKKK